MHAVVVSVKIPEDRDAEAEELFENEVLPRVTQAPGFVSATWISWPNDSEKTDTSIVLYDSKEHADEAARRALEPAESLVTVVSVEVGAVSAQA